MKQTLSATLFAQEASLVSVEASFTKGLPHFSIVGLASNAIQESKERVKSALLHQNFNFPPLRITLNLSPSDLQKEGTHFDLPIALSIALHDKASKIEEYAIFGELGLDGKVKSTATLFALVLSFALKATTKKVIIPKESAQQFSLISNLEFYPVASLQEAIAFLEGTITVEPLEAQHIEAQSIEIATQKFYYSDRFELDFKEVRGQSIAKKAALIAAAGNHNLLLEGNPGSGKSMIAKRLQGILPPLTHNEILTLAKLSSLEGEHSCFEPLRPFRAPHSSSTQASIFGGGSHKARIGEAGLAHLGILFFDEFPHYSKSTLEALREPLEDKKIRISRVNTKLEYATNFLFVAAMNPCPCGNLLSSTKECRCSEIEVKRYKNRLSDPLLDRIDLYVTMQETQADDRGDISSKEMQTKVFNAFELQRSRDQKGFNSDLTQEEMQRFCTLNKASQDMLNLACSRFALSARAVDKTVKVARTIADLNAHDSIEQEDLLEALSYRKRS